ncbi:MAG: glycosyltransferase family protein [Bdellovibrionota bacterium]
MNILAIVNGFGLGNATRCEPLFMEFAREVKPLSIDIATSGNGVAYFRGRPYVRRLVRLRSLNYGGGTTGISLFGLLSALPRTFVSFFSNALVIAKTLRRNDYDLVLIDSDYTALVFRIFSRVPVVAVNNSESVIAECLRTRPPVSVWPQFLVELFDFLFHRWVPTLTLAPTLNPSTVESRAVVPIPLLSRFTSTRNRKNEPARPFRVFFMFSASELGPDPRDFIRICPRDVVVTRISKDNRANPDGSFRDVSNELQLADLIVSNAGLGTISDAIATRTPILVVPISGHCEQWANAKMIERLGLGEASTMETFPAKLRMIRDDYEAYREAFERFTPRQEHSPRLAVSVVLRRLALAEPMGQSSESHRAVTVETNV